MKRLALLAPLAVFLILSVQDGEAAPYDDGFRPPAVAVHCENGECPSVVLCAPDSVWDAAQKACRKMSFCPGDRRVQTPGGSCELYCRPGTEVNPFDKDRCRRVFSCPPGKAEMADGVCEVRCPDGQRENPFAPGSCRPAFSCLPGKVEAADGVCEIPCPDGQRENPFARGNCRPEFSCPENKIEVADGVCGCPHDLPHDVGGICGDKPRCSGGLFSKDIECECLPGMRRFNNGFNPSDPKFSFVSNYDFCAVPRDCQEPYVRDEFYNECVWTGICPEEGDSRHAACRMEVARRSLQYSDCPAGEGNEACRAEVKKARSANEFLASPVSRIQGIARARELTLTGKGVTIGAAENASPYWKDDCRTMFEIGPSQIDPPHEPFPQPDEEVVARYNGGGCQEGLVRTHSQLPTIRVVGARRTDPLPSSQVSRFFGGGGVRSVSHIVGVFGVMAAREDGYGLVGVAPDAEYFYADSYHDWGEPQTADVEIVNHSYGAPTNITSVAQVDEFGGILTQATRETLIADTKENRRQDLAAALSHVSSVLAADRQIHVWAAGNDSFGNLDITSGMPLYFPELRNNNLAVAAVEGGLIARYSNRCGLAGGDFCLAAPVDGWAIMPDIEQGTYDKAGGTSTAAPVVSGALALVKEYYNRMGGIGSHELVQRILATADKSGRYADESIYGAGLLDLGNALAPQGGLHLLAGRNVEDAEWHRLSVSGLRPGSALGDSVGRSLRGLTLAAFDALNAPFPISPGTLLSSWGLPSGPGAALRARQGRELSGGFGISDGTEERSLGAWWSLNASGDSRLASGGGLREFSNPYAALAGAGLSAGMGWDDFRIAAFGEGLGSARRVRGALAEFSLRSGLGEAGAVSFQFGGLEELDGLLSSSGSGIFGDLRARTAFAGLGIWGELPGSWRFRAGGFSGRTSAAGGAGWLSPTDGLWSGSYALGVERGDVLRLGDGLGFRVHQPLRASGGLRMRVPTGRTRYGDLTWREVSGGPSGRELAVEGLYRRPVEGGSWLLSAGMISDPGHRSDAKTLGRALFAFEREF